MAVIEAVLFNWSGTLSDYGGRGKVAWYQAAGVTSTTPQAEAVTHLARIWPQHAATIATLKLGVLSLLQFLQVNHIPIATLTTESNAVLATLVAHLASFDITPTTNCAASQTPEALTNVLQALAIDNPAHVLGIFDQQDWLIAAQGLGLNTIGVLIGSRHLGLSAQAWHDLPLKVRHQKLLAARGHLAQLGVDNTVADARALLLLMRQLCHLEVQR